MPTLLPASQSRPPSLVRTLNVEERLSRLIWQACFSGTPVRCFFAKSILAYLELFRWTCGTDGKQLHWERRCIRIREVAPENSNPHLHKSERNQDPENQSHPTFCVDKAQLLRKPRRRCAGATILGCRIRLVLDRSWCQLCLSRIHNSQSGFVRQNTSF